MSLWVDVVFPAGVDLCLSYAVPDQWSDQVQVGSLVRIPIGNRESSGLVIRMRQQRPDFAEIKELSKLYDFVIDAQTIAFWEWIGQYYLAPWNRVLDICLPSDLEQILKPVKEQMPEPVLLWDKPLLTSDQKQALENYFQKTHSSYLLHGITGSGKTRVMLEMALEQLSKGKQVLWLVPEIGLTPQVIDYLKTQISVPLDVLHSSLGAGQKRRTWQRILRGEVRLVVGTRSALLAPYNNLGLILVDEEHDQSYKQTDPSPRYHARDAALWRGHQLQIPVVLASATPSLESFRLAEQGKLGLLNLKSRPLQAHLPQVHLVDMKVQREIQGDLALSIELREAMYDAIDRGEQVILLHNRRGYAASLICKNCGQVCKCKHCDVSLTLHKSKKTLKCHYCDSSLGLNLNCSQCGAVEFQEYGLAIEKVEEEIRDFFPHSTLLRMDRDSTAKQGQLENLLDEFRAQKAQILLGTQMVVKGHDFPKVSVVGVIAADQALQSPDFRAGEYAFQLLTQVAGRAGRDEIPGHVYLQSFEPKSELFEQASKQDYTRFYTREMEHRQILNYPPFSRLIKVEFSSRNKMEAWGAAKEFAALAERNLQGTSVRILGPADAVISLLRGEYRVQILIFGTNYLQLKHLVQKIRQNLPSYGRTLKIHFDVDPKSF